MQDRDISSIEFYKVLQEVEKYRKLKADIRNQAKAKVKQITKEQREELLEQGKKEDKEDFLRKIANTSGIQGVGVISNMKLLHLTTCDFMVCKDYKSTLKIFFPIHQVNLRIQQLTCSPIYHHVTIHHDIILKLVPSKFPSRVIPQLLIIHFFVDDLLPSKFIQTRLTDGVIWEKNNLFGLCDGAFDGFFKLFLCFHTVSMGYIQLFCKP